MYCLYIFTLHLDQRRSLSTKKEIFMRTILIDNYDSFTWNVYQYLCELGAKVVVFRNDQVTMDELIALKPRNIVISPGNTKS